jgi:hypothetical protein
MKTENTYDFSISMITSLGSNVEETAGTGDFSSFLRIRRELNHFLLNLNHSNRADGAGQQIHFLFVALDHLENVDKEIRISGADQDTIRLEKIHEKIRSLKYLILNYIKQITAEN